MSTRQGLLRNLPKVDECIKQLDKFVDPEVPPSVVKLAVQRCIEDRRRRILAGEAVVELSDDGWRRLFIGVIAKRKWPNFRRVINGTGVVIHTNFGRSLLSRKAVEALLQAGMHYSNLEFDLATGKRGSRYGLVENIICDLTGAEAALVVNNNAAAVLLVLETLARGTEVIVSRGQLVEIGGSFRIPDVMAKSGALMIEVGTTNRTHRFDYERAITPATSMLLKVHTSNFRIIGFTSEFTAEEMVNLAQQHGLLVMEDLGSGCLLDLSRFGLPREPMVWEVVKAGVDVVTFSGDKLLGGPQAGIIVGKRDVIERVKRNPLNRALRIDKLTLSSLEMILREYFDINAALQNIPTLAMLTISADRVKRRAQALLRRTRKHVVDRCVISLLSTVSQVGGGAMPEFNLPTWAVAIEPQDTSLNSMESDFRRLPVPLIGRIENDNFILDMRTIQEDEITMVADILTAYFGKGPLS